MPRRSSTVVELLSAKPPQRTSDDVEQLITYLADQPFFTGVSSSSLELLSTCITLQHAAPGEVVLHAGELTDRLFLLLGGSCSVVRHSRKEGFQPQPACMMQPGQTLCEASLVQSGRRSDVAMTATSEQGPQSAAAGAVAAEGGANFAVVTRAAWANMCARAPMKPEYGEARIAMLCCCARALAAVDPAVRTLEQCEDLAALLRLLPGLSHTSAPVVRAMSEAAYLRQLPPGTIMFEECTRAESEFVVLSGAVETHNRPKRQGAANRAALRSALRSAVAAARTKSAKGGPKSFGAATDGPKTVRQKIEEERRAREEIKQSLVLQREGLRTPPPRAQPGKPSGAKAVEEEFKKWMLEFLTRKRAGETPGQTSGNPADVPAGTGGKPPPATAAASVGGENEQTTKVTNAWRRVAFKATHHEDEGGGDGAVDEGGGEAEAEMALKRSDTTMMEYERRKREEAGGVKDVGNLLGGAAARKAYERGLGKGADMYGGYEDLPDDEGAADAAAGGVHWGNGDDINADADVDDIDEDEEEEDPWVRLTYLDRRYRVVNKAIRYIDAVEKVMGINKDSSSKGPQDAGGGRGAQASPGPGQSSNRDRPGDADDSRNPDDIHLLLLSGVEGPGGDGDGDAEDRAGSDAEGEVGLRDGGPGRTGSSAQAAAASGGAPGELGLGPGPSVEIDDACDEHFEQLYGQRGDRVEQGQVVGDLPAAVLDRSTRAAQRPRRAHSAIAGPTGADVLVVVLETLRRGHDAARDDLVSERLAVLTALEPLRGLTDDNQTQLALGCTVSVFDANHVVVRQGQPVDALYVVLEGEVRLLDDTDTTSAGGTAAAAQPTATAAAAGSPTSSPTASSSTTTLTPDSPFRSLASGTKIVSLKTRRAAASFSALTLLGPGGSFGENVLGYPEDVAHGSGSAALDVVDASQLSQYLATAMTSRSTKLLVLPRPLLLKYGYLRTSLPPFADLRREALNGRRQQLKAARPAAGSLNVATQAAAERGSDGGAGSSNSGPVAHVGQLQLPALPSPTGSAVYQTPRPPPVRPSEVLEQLGFKPVGRRAYNGVSKVASSPAAPLSVMTSANTGSNGGSCGGAGASSANSFVGSAGTAAAAPAVTSGAGSSGSLDRQRRQDLLAASSFAPNTPQHLNNALARARGEDASSYSTSLPVVISGHTSMPPRRASADGAATGIAPAGVQLPVGLPGAAPAKPLMLRISMSGLGAVNGPHSDGGPASPIRRSSMSGVMVASGAAGQAGQGAHASPPRAGRLHVGSTTGPAASGMLPRLSVPGNANFTGAVTGTGARPQQASRVSLTSEPFLTRLDGGAGAGPGGEGSPRSFSPVPLRSGRSGSTGNVAAVASSAGSGVLTSVPMPVQLLQQRSAGNQPARA